MSPHAENDADARRDATGQPLATKSPLKVPPRLFTKQPSLSRFRDLCSQSTHPATYPLAQSIQKNIPVYDLSSFQNASPSTLSSLQDEWHHIVLAGPGVLILKNMYPDLQLLSTANDIYDSIIMQEKSHGNGDHFSGGTNDRVWNSFGKHGLADPVSFIHYYSNPWLHLICDTWLGPAYRITAQVNVVNPAGQAQICHRDYYLGFQSQEACARFPAAMHVASQQLTLQGAVAHSDMPVESGPTRFLPFSQMFAEGFLAYRLPEFIDFFNQEYVMLPLETGDGVFFNPALFHAAGENRLSDFRRKANLLQVSSAFGKTMESIDSVALIERCWDVLQEKVKHMGMTDEVVAAVRAIVEGYPFPTNLDRRQPALGGMEPESEQEVCLRGLRERWRRRKVVEVLSGLKEECTGGDAISD